MNKSDVKLVMDAIEKTLKKQKTYSVMEHSNSLAWDVLKELYDGGREFLDFNNIRYILKYYPSTTNSLSNRSTTPEFQIKRQTLNSVLDIDNLLSSTEINVCNFHGGQPKGFEEPIPLESVDDVMRVVKHFYEHTKLNIMVHRQTTGDVTIWVDEKRFQQR